MPNASSPPWVLGPSASTSPGFTFRPAFTNGFWFTEVAWFDLLNFLTSKVCFLFVSCSLTTISSPVTDITSPEIGDIKASPESRATFSSIPVPTYGASVVTNGTACLCIFEPIKALFASSCSRKGINAVVTEQICFGLTSMYSISLSLTKETCPPFCLDKTLLFLKVPSSFKGAFAWAIVYSSSWEAVR